MPLRIKLPANDKLIINGAVLENGGDSTILVVHNRADILRRKEIMQEEDAISPARMVYYSLQCAYMFEDMRAEYLKSCLRYLDSYIEAAASAAPLISEIKEMIAAGQFYRALKRSHELIKHESIRLGTPVGE